jgi:hypothetical protein
MRLAAARHYDLGKLIRSKAIAAKFHGRQADKQSVSFQDGAVSLYFKAV